MKVEQTTLAGLLIVAPQAFSDDRGVFFESWERDRYADLGLPATWRQDNVVRSGRGVLRGMHFQHPNAQHKLITVLAGEIYDVAVDMRRGSPTFGQWLGMYLSAENRLQLSIPAGFAHGYLSMTDGSIVSYKCSERYDSRTERSLRWDDRDVGIQWPEAPRVVSPKDRDGLLLRDFGPDDLPAA